MSQEKAYRRAGIMLRAWSRLRPKKTFFRLSLRQFQDIVARSTAAREKVARMEALARAARAERDEADEAMRRAVRCVIYAVKGDAEEGPDGELLAAMGYLPRTVRAAITSAARRQGASSLMELDSADGEEAVDDL